jgi:hypothetical protein
MEERLKGLLEQPGKWYDWVVILGGKSVVTRYMRALMQSHT